MVRPSWRWRRRWSPRLLVEVWKLISARAQQRQSQMSYEWDIVVGVSVIAASLWQRYKKLHAVQKKKKNAAAAKKGPPAWVRVDAWCVGACAWTRLSSMSHWQNILRASGTRIAVKTGMHLSGEWRMFLHADDLTVVFLSTELMFHILYVQPYACTHTVHAFISTPLSLLPWERERGNTRTHRTALLYDGQDRTNRYFLTLVLFTSPLPSWHWASIATRQTVFEQASGGWQSPLKSSLAFSCNFHRHNHNRFSTVTLLQSNLRHHARSTSSSNNERWYPLSSSATATSRVAARRG